MLLEQSKELPHATDQMTYLSRPWSYLQLHFFAFFILDGISNAYCGESGCGGCERSTG